MSDTAKKSTSSSSSDVEPVKGDTAAGDTATRDDAPTEELAEPVGPAAIGNDRGPCASPGEMPEGGRGS